MSVHVFFSYLQPHSHAVGVISWPSIVTMVDNVALGHLHVTVQIYITVIHVSSAKKLVVVKFAQQISSVSQVNVSLEKYVKKNSSEYIASTNICSYANRYRYC